MGVRSQLGKLGHFGGGCGADLGKRSPHYLVRQWCTALSVATRTLRSVGSVCCLGNESARPRGVAQKRYPSHDGPGNREASTPPLQTAAERSRTAYGSLPTASARTLLQFGLATPCPVALVEIATRRAFQRLVLTATASRGWPTALPLLPLTHGVSPSRWFAVRSGIQRASPSWHRAGRMAGEVRRCRRTRVGTAGALLQVHAFQLWWCVVDGGAATFTCVHGRLTADVKTAPSLL